MKKIAIITFYDMICYGTRMVSSIAKKEGIEPHLILVKDEKSHVPIWRDKDEYSTYQYFFNGLMRGSLYAVDPITSNEKNLLIEQLHDINPDLICLSTRSFAYGLCKDIFSKIKQNFKDIPVLSGGWGPTLEPEKFLEFSDYVFFGEAERAISEIFRRLINSANTHDVLRSGSNIIYFNKGSLVRNTVGKPLSSKEMDSMPFPDFDVDNKYLIANNTIKYGRDFYNPKIYDCFAGRGCPMNCSYCMSSKYEMLYKEQYQVHCPKYRLRSVDRVIEELKGGKRNGAKIIRIKDEVFPTSKKWIDQFIERYRSEINLPFFGYIRPEYHSPETIEKLIEIGLYVTIVGIQSGCERIRKNIYYRNLPKEKIIEFAKLLKSNGLDFIYHLIYQNPFEKEADLEETLSLTYQLPYAKVCIYKLEKFPESPIAKMIDQIHPVGAGKMTNLWYANLYTLACKGAVYRRISKVVHKYGFFRKAPLMLSLIFLPELLKEAKIYFWGKKKYGVRARLLPSQKSLAKLSNA